MLQASSKPNILVIMGDDIGWSNASIYNRGMMGYKTPNIDKIGQGGIMFTDYYAEQSCTAGRSTFILGQSAYRTGLTKVGFPGAKEGISKKDPTIAELLKNEGYATGQFGKNHLGDNDNHLPTNHGFDEFLGNLYHLNAEEEPENADYPKNAEFKKKFGPRGVIHSFADGKIEDTGPLTKKRMETIDQETMAATIDFMERSVKMKKPFFAWYASTRMHIWTHLSKEYKDKTGFGIYADGMQELDDIVGKLLGKLDELGVADNTIVIFTTDNGAELMFWPDGGTTPFQSEKGTSWEGGFRAPSLIKWPKKIKPHQIKNGIISGLDWMPTLLAAAGVSDIKEKLLKGYKANGKEFKVHLDGYNQLPYLTGDSNKSARKEMFFFSDDGELTALRYDKWKIHFKIQKAHGMDVWREEFTSMRMPLIMDLRADPFERAFFESSYFDHWMINRVFLLVPAQQVVSNFLETFKEFPQRQKIGSFSLDNVLELMNKSTMPSN